MRSLALAVLGFAAVAAPALAQVSVVDGGMHFALPVTSLRDIPFRTTVRQQYDFSCGSAALATLLRYHYGVPVSEADVFQAMYRTGDQAKIRQVGFSLLDMKRYLAARGLAADGFRVGLDDLARAQAPAISVVRIGAYRHFVVIKGVRGDAVLVGDPALGLKTYSRAEFARMWNGVIFVLRSDGDAPIYNADAEWRPWAVAPLGQALTDEGLAAFTRDLPPLYQVSHAITIDTAGR